MKTIKFAKFLESIQTGRQVNEVSQIDVRNKFFYTLGIDGDGISDVVPVGEYRKEVRALLHKRYFLSTLGVRTDKIRAALNLLKIKSVTWGELFATLS